MNEETVHKPVLLQEVVSVFSEHLQRAGRMKQETFLFDGTVGGGGHSRGILERSPQTYLIAADRDQNALQRAAHTLAPFSGRCVFLHGRFGDLSSLHAEARQKLSALLSRPVSDLLFDAMLVDLGISSDQLDDLQRGFSFDSPALDMRMDRSQKLTALDVLNNYSVQELQRVFRRGDVGSRSRRLALETAARRPLSSGREFAVICEKVLGAGAKKNPATLPFLALRIEVNDEFGEIERFFDAALEHLAPRGLLGAISFHSLEDKLVTSRMRSWSREERMSRRLPSSRPALGRLLTKEAIAAGEEERSNNVRSRSALLRLFEKAEEGEVRE